MAQSRRPKATRNSKKRKPYPPVVDEELSIRARQAEAYIQKEFDVSIAIEGNSEDVIKLLRALREAQRIRKEAEGSTSANGDAGGRFARAEAVRATWGTGQVADR